MRELVLVAFLGGVVLAAFLYVRRLVPAPATDWWAAAWACLFASGMLEVLDPGAAGQALARLPGPFFFAFTLAGARRYLARDLPRWLLPAAAASALAAAAAVPTFGLRTALLAETPFEVAVTVLAAAELHRGLARREAPAAERLLPIAVAGLAPITVLNALLRPEGPVEFAALTGWAGAALAVALVQIGALTERLRQSEARLLREHALLHRVASSAADLRPPEEVTASVLSFAGPEAGFDALAVWRATPDGSAFELLADGGTLGGAPEGTRRLEASRPLVSRALASRGPVRVRAPSRDPRVHPEVRDRDFGELMVQALRVGERCVGLLAAGVGRDRSFSPEDERLVGALGNEIALAVAHLSSVAEREERAVELQTLVDAVPLGIALVDAEGRIVRLNRKALELAGGGDHDPARWIGVRGRELVEAIGPRLDPASRLVLDRRLRSLRAGEAGAVEPFTLRLQRSRRFLEVEAQPVRGARGRLRGRVFVVRDVTEERRREEQKAHARRMQTLGMLAGGVAHDFNNQLTTILGTAELLAAELPEGDPSRELVGQLERAALHCAELTRDLLDFSRRTPPEPDAVDLGELLREVEGVVRPELPPGIALSLAVDPGLGPLAADRGQLRRVLLNLILNARDAVGDRGRIEVRARRRPKGPEDTAEIEVRDDGPGMAEEVRLRIFEPFFTTKPLGRGTGLGLAIVYGIVESHGGRIEVESEPGDGTRFLIAWPLAAAPGSRPEPLPGLDRAVGRVLVAEDEPVVRDLARRALEAVGFRVDAVEDGAEALRALGTSGEPYRALVLDLDMPRVDGARVLEVMTERGIELPTLLISGNPGRAGQVPLATGRPMLAKPFGLERLARAVLELLGARGGEGGAPDAARGPGVERAS